MISNMNIISGGILSLSGIYLLKQAENKKQKAIATVVMAIGVAILAQKSPWFAEKEISLRCVEAKSLLEMKTSEEGSELKELFDFMRNTVGVSCDNYLPWKNRFHIDRYGRFDGISIDHLKASIMWGIDKWNRAYIAIKPTLNGAAGRIYIFYQYFSHPGSQVNFICHPNPGALCEKHIFPLDEEIFGQSAKEFIQDSWSRILSLVE